MKRYFLFFNFQACFTPIARHENKIGILPSPGDFWGVCSVAYSKTDTPEAQVKCTTCVSSGCLHVKALLVELGKESGEDDALSLFQYALATPPLLQMRYEKVSYSEAKIPVFPGSEYSTSTMEGHYRITNIFKYVPFLSSVLKNSRFNIHFL